MSCFGSDYDDENQKADGECPDCGEPTFEGSAIGGCSYSPVICETCGDCPCDQSC